MTRFKIAAEEAEKRLADRVNENNESSVIPVSIRATVARIFALLDGHPDIKLVAESKK